jgi:Mu-like prophage major head subunit gpT
MSDTILFEKSVERINAEAASLHAMFGGQRKVAGSRAGDPTWNHRVLEAERFMWDIRHGRRPISHFAEAMSTSDFPLLFADSLDRQLYGAYMATIPTWTNYARAATVNDFRPVKRFATSGVRGLLKKVGELDEHERRSQTETEYSYAVDKYEAGFGLSWEAMINDDLGAFVRLPQDLADSVRDSEEEFVTRLICDASGPHATNYTSGNANLLNGNPVLTRDNLQAAITKLMKRKDDKGNPIVVKAVRLVVGTGLALVAQEIIDTVEYRVVDGNGNIRIIKGNGVAANLGVDINYWIDSVATTANADTSWWVFADPAGSRPALEFGRLRGFEAPALYEKVPDMRRMGGGEEPFSFDTESQEKKVKHVYGGTFVDAKMTMASNGSGS